MIGLLKIRILLKGIIQFVLTNIDQNIIVDIVPMLLHRNY